MPNLPMICQVNTKNPKTCDERVIVKGYSPDIISATIVFIFDQDHRGWFDSINVVNGRCPFHQTFPVTRPPVFRSELNDVFYTIIVYDVSTKTTFSDKGMVFPILTLLKKVLMLA